MAGQGSFEVLGREKYVRLTTFKRDGTPVATAVWVVPDGDALAIITDSATGKAKRLRHTSRVLIAPSDGNLTPGAHEVEATATLSDAAVDVARLKRLVRGKYGIQLTMSSLVNRLRTQGNYRPVHVRVMLPPD